MKSTGIIRRVDELGRVVIPIEIRNKFSISEKDPIEIYVEGSSIILKKIEPNCIFCGNSKSLTTYKDKLICTKCAKKISELSEFQHDRSERRKCKSYGIRLIVPRSFISFKRCLYLCTCSAVLLIITVQ